MLSVTKGILIDNLILDGVRVEDVVVGVLTNLSGLFLVNSS